jgi:hypothetical protein
MVKHLYSMCEALGSTQALPPPKKKGAFQWDRKLTSSIFFIYINIYIFIYKYIYLYYIYLYI